MNSIQTGVLLAFAILLLGCITSNELTNAQNQIPSQYRIQYSTEGGKQGLSYTRGSFNVSNEKVLSFDGNFGDIDRGVQTTDCRQTTDFVQGTDFCQCTPDSDTLIRCQERKITIDELPPMSKLISEITLKSAGQTILQNGNCYSFETPEEQIEYCIANGYLARYTNTWHQFGFGGIQKWEVTDTASVVIRS